VSGVSEEELSDLYAEATATFFPSKYEGFGLPVLESMASGTPIVTCNNSSLGEIGGDAALYVEPEDIEAMANLMAGFENKTLDRVSLTKNCLNHVDRFTWSACAQKTVEVYKKCLDL
jgi:glycosyltransferase involved in cell wall biosynthesis